jgi:hypothetical protein
MADIGAGRHAAHFRILAELRSQCGALICRDGLSPQRRRAYLRMFAAVLAFEESMSVLAPR